MRKTFHQPEQAMLVVEEVVIYGRLLLRQSCPLDNHAYTEDGHVESVPTIDTFKRSQQHNLISTRTRRSRRVSPQEKEDHRLQVFPGSKRVEGSLRVWKPCPTA